VRAYAVYAQRRCSGAFMTQVLPGDKLTPWLMHVVLNDLKKLTAIY
jgi:hypothetical protein